MRYRMETLGWTRSIAFSFPIKAWILRLTGPIERTSRPGRITFQIQRSATSAQSSSAAAPRYCRCRPHCGDPPQLLWRPILLGRHLKLFSQHGAREQHGIEFRAHEHDQRDHVHPVEQSDRHSERAVDNTVIGVVLQVPAE